MSQKHKRLLRLWMIKDIGWSKMCVFATSGIHGNFQRERLYDISACSDPNLLLFFNKKTRKHNKSLQNKSTRDAL